MNLFKCAFEEITFSKKKKNFYFWYKSYRKNDRLQSTNIVQTYESIYILVHFYCIFVNFILS